MKGGGGYEENERRSAAPFCSESSRRLPDFSAALPADDADLLTTLGSYPAELRALDAERLAVDEA